MLQRSLLAIAGGLLLTAAFEPIAIGYLVPVGVALFALAIGDLKVRRAGLIGLVFGVAFYFTHIEWMRESVGTDAWIALASVEAVFYGLLGMAVPVLRRLPASPLWLAAGWTTMETIRSSWPFSGMPWGRLSFAAIDTPAAPAVAYVGMTGLSFVLALAGFLLADALRAAWPVLRRSADARSALWGRSAALVGVLAALLVPAVFPFGIEESGETTVAVVQGDVPGPGNDILYDHRGVTRNHVEATKALADDVASGDQPQPDFVVWPENSTAVDPFADSSVNEEIKAAARAIDVPIIVGGIVGAGEEHVLNQGIVWDPVTGPGDRYTKHHPVPYGEYIPYRKYWDPKFGQLALITRDQKSGTRTEPLRVAGVEVADAICFDVAYDDVFPEQVRDGAELLAVQTSNASFIFTHQIEQQFAITRLRALEAGRYLAVASTNGRTGVIGPDGAVLQTVSPRTTAVLVEEVALSSTLTPAMWMGPWPTRLLFAATLVALAAGAVIGRRRRSAVATTSGHESDADPDATPETTPEEVPVG